MNFSEKEFELYYLYKQTIRHNEINFRIYDKFLIEKIKLYFLNCVLKTNKYPYLIKSIEQYIKLYPECINLQDRMGNTMLILSIINVTKGSSKETVKMLLENGANVNIQNNSGYTALMYTIMNYGNIILNITDIESFIYAMFYIFQDKLTEIVDMILKYNPNVKLQNKYGDTVISIASNFLASINGKSMIDILTPTRKKFIECITPTFKFCNIGLCDFKIVHSQCNAFQKILLTM